MTRTWSTLVGLLLLPAVAWGGDVRLVQAGTAPRPLRYAPAGAQAVGVALDVSMNSSVSGQAIAVNVPTVSTVARTTVASTSGGHTVSWKLDPAAVARGGQLERMAAEALRTSMSEASGTFVVDALGRVTQAQASLKPSPQAAPGAPQVDTSAYDPSRWVVPLPSEAVGVGGSWAVVESSVVEGMTTEGTTTYSIVSIDGPTVVLSVVGLSKVSGSTSLGDGVDLVIPGASVTTSARVTLRLDRPFPTSWVMTSTQSGSVKMLGMTVPTTTVVMSTLSAAR